MFFSTFFPDMMRTETFAGSTKPLQEIPVALSNKQHQILKVEVSPPPAHLLSLDTASAGMVVLDIAQLLRSLSLPVTALLLGFLQARWFVAVL